MFPHPPSRGSGTLSLRERVDKEELGGVQEWLIWLARKASVPATVPWVRIPPPPPCVLWLRPCANRACELRQARKGAAVCGALIVPQIA